MNQTGLVCFQVGNEKKKKKKKKNPEGLYIEQSMKCTERIIKECIMREYSGQAMIKCVVILL